VHTLRHKCFSGFPRGTTSPSSSSRAFEGSGAVAPNPFVLQYEIAKYINLTSIVGSNGIQDP